MEDILKKTENDMKEVYSHLKLKFNSINLYKADLNILNEVKVEYYNSYISLKEISSITIDDATTILIKPWEKNIINKIQNSILKHNSDFSVFIKEDFLVVKIPLLTEERRIKLKKDLSSESEAGKILIRNIRKTSKENFKKLKKSDDEINILKIDLQKMTDRYIKMINILVSDKIKKIIKI